MKRNCFKTKYREHKLDSRMMGKITVITLMVLSCLPGYQNTEVTNEITTELCRDRLGYFRPYDFKISSCAMCYFYLAIENPEYTLYPELTVKTLHSHPYLLTSVHGERQFVYPDLDNATSVNAVCDTLDDVTGTRWVTCCKDAWDCCERQLLRTIPTDGAVYCPQTFDGWDCWDFTPANTTVTQSCPNFLTSNHNAVSSKTCNSDGRWETGINTSLEYTVYDNCSKQDELQIYRTAIVLGVALNVLGIVLLLPSISIFLVYNSLRRQQRIKIHANLFGSILIAAVLSLIWDVVVRMDRLNNSQDHSVMYTQQTFCKSLNVVLRFSRVTMIFWMSCEGFYLHQLLINAFAHPRRLYGYCIYGWGVPVVLCGIYAVLRKCLADDSACWILPLEGSQRSIDWFLVYGPAILCLLGNIIFLVNIIKLLMKKMIHHPNEPNGFRRTLKATFLLVPLFGLHQFCLVYRPGSDKDEGYNVYEIFSAIILNSQGLIISVLFCFANKEIQSHLKISFKNVTRRYSLRRQPNDRTNSLTSTSRRTSFSSLQIATDVYSVKNGHNRLNDYPNHKQTGKHNDKRGFDNMAFDDELMETKSL